MPKIMSTAMLFTANDYAKRIGLESTLTVEEINGLEQHAYHIIDQAVHVGATRSGDNKHDNHHVRCKVLLRQKDIVEPTERTLDFWYADYNAFPDAPIQTREPVDFDASDGNAG